MAHSKNKLYYGIIQSIFNIRKILNINFVGNLIGNIPYTVSGKEATILLPVTPNADHFHNSFTITLSSKYAVKESLNLNI